jgi:hypothetical protein
MATAALRARVCRETDGAYLKAAGIGVRPPAKPANENEVTTASDAAKPPPTIKPNPKTFLIRKKQNRPMPMW